MTLVRPIAGSSAALALLAGALFVEPAGSSPPTCNDPDSCGVLHAETECTPAKPCRCIANECFSRRDPELINAGYSPSSQFQNYVVEQVQVPCATTIVCTSDLQDPFECDGDHPCEEDEGGQVQNGCEWRYKQPLDPCVPE